MHATQTQRTTRPRTRLAIFFWIMPQSKAQHVHASTTVLHLLFSFELCKACASALPLFHIQSCYFLLNYAPSPIRKPTVPRLYHLAIFFWIMHTCLLGGWYDEDAVWLAIFFWIMLAVWRPLMCTHTMNTCYFLLNYAWPRRGRRYTTTSGALAIFFWIMLNRVLNRPTGGTAVTLLFSFELC